MNDMSFPVRPSADTAEIHRGNALASGELVVWSGRPTLRRISRDVFHLRGCAIYFAGLLALDAAQAWHKHMPLAKALHDSVPLAVLIAVGTIIILSLSFLVARTTRYTITDRRAILRYGIAMQATLSLPYSEIVGVAVGVNKDGTGDIALELRSGNRMAWLKLWPLARAWHVTNPQPMLRGIVAAGHVGSLVTRAIQVAEQGRPASSVLPPTEALTDGGRGLAPVPIFAGA